MTKLINIAEKNRIIVIFVCIMIVIFSLLIATNKQKLNINTFKNKLNAEGQNITYEVKNRKGENVNTLITVNSLQGIESIKYFNNNGEEIELKCGNKLCVAFDYEVQNKNTYYFTVKRLNEVEKIEQISVDLPEIPQTLELFNNGDLCEEITGGWTGWFSGGTDPSVGNYEISNTLNLNTWGIWSGYSIRTINKIDITQYSKIVYEYDYISGLGGYAHGEYYILNSSLTPILSKSMENGQNGIIEQDLTSMTEPNFVSFGLCNGGSCQISRIYLVK